MTTYSMSITKQVQKSTLRDIVLEASAYAKLHGLNLVAYMDNDNEDEAFDSVMHCTLERGAVFCVHLFGELPEEVQSSIMDPDPEPDPVPKVKWSLFWGLFKRYV